MSKITRNRESGVALLLVLLALLALSAMTAALVTMSSHGNHRERQLPVGRNGIFRVESGPL